MLRFNASSQRPLSQPPRFDHHLTYARPCYAIICAALLGWCLKERTGRGRSSFTFSCFLPQPEAAALRKLRPKLLFRYAASVPREVNRSSEDSKEEVKKKKMVVCGYGWPWIYCAFPITILFVRIRRVLAAAAAAL